VLFYALLHSLSVPEKVLPFLAKNIFILTILLAVKIEKNAGRGNPNNQK